MPDTCASKVHAGIGHGVQALLQRCGRDVMLVLAHSDTLGIDLHQFGQWILQSACDGDVAPDRHLSVTKPGGWLSWKYVVETCAPGTCKKSGREAVDGRDLVRGCRARPAARPKVGARRFLLRVRTSRDYRKARRWIGDLRSGSDLRRTRARGRFDTARALAQAPRVRRAAGPPRDGNRTGMVDREWR